VLDELLGVDGAIMMVHTHFRRCLYGLVLTAAFTSAGCASNADVQDVVVSSAPVSESVSTESENLSECDPNYGGACIPIVNYDLDCPDVTGPVYVVGRDVHGFDRDKNGIGCEPYP